MHPPGCDRDDEKNDDDDKKRDKQTATTRRLCSPVAKHDSGIGLVAIEPVHICSTRVTVARTRAAILFDAKISTAVTTAVDIANLVGRTGLEPANLPPPKRALYQLSYRPIDTSLACSRGDPFQ